MAFPKGGKHSKETLKKISNALVGRKFTHEHRIKIGLANRTRVITEETRQKMSLAKKGKKLSLEHIKNRDAARRGYKHSEATKAKLLKLHLGVKRSAKARVNMSGENHWNWQGGISSKNARLRQSTEYKQWRTAVFKRDNYICQECGERGGKLNADHIKRFSEYPELRFELDNGRTLCVPCHARTPTYKNNRRELICQ